MNCVTHTKSPAVAQCDECGRPICQLCYDSFELPNDGVHLCADCFKKEVNEEISEVNSLISMTKREIGFIIFGFFAGLIGSIVLLVMILTNQSNLDSNPLMFALIPLAPFLFGSLMTIVKRVIRAVKASDDGEEGSWVVALIVAIIVGWFMLLISPIITIYRFVVRIKDKKQLNVILGNDQHLLTAIDNFIAESLKPSIVEQSAAGGDVEISLDAILASSAGSDAALCDNGEILRTIRTR